MSRNTSPPVILSPRALAVALPLLAAVAFSGGCTDGEDQAGAPRWSAPSATASGSTAATAPSIPAASASPTAKVKMAIPTAAFVELPVELRSGSRRATAVVEALPELCGDEFGTSGKKVTASASMTHTYKLATAPASNVPQGVIRQTVFTFKSDGAAEYLRRVRDAVRACPSYNRTGSTVTSQSLTGVGDEALLVTRKWAATDPNGELTGGDTSTQIAVARVAGAVTVLDDQGWESASGNPEILNRVARAAAAAVESWQR